MNEALLNMPQDEFEDLIEPDLDSEGQKSDILYSLKIDCPSDIGWSDIGWCNGDCVNVTCKKCWLNSFRKMKEEING